MSSVYHGDSRDLTDLEHECKKFRICIIGRTGVGKSTLLAKVFGFSDKEARVSGKGDGRGKHNVWDEIHDDERNRALIIHDSGGFEAGESNTLQNVMDFIKFRGNQDSLAAQLHCIWYCIPLDTDRPIQSAEEDFFKFFANKKVPLVFVFTKYDKLVREYLDEIAPEDEDRTSAAKREAEQRARKYVSKIRHQLQCATGKGVTVQEVSRRDDELVKTLVRSTTDLVRPNLQSLLIRAQGVSATSKRQGKYSINQVITILLIETTECIRILPSKFNSVLVQCAIPGNVFKSKMLTDRFGEMFRLCSLVWNIPGQEVLFVRENIIDSFRDAVQSGRNLAGVFSAIDVAGPLTAAVYVRLCLKMACDLILIFQQLFWATTRAKFLREDELHTQLNEYKTSKLKQMVHKLVDGSMAAVDLISAFSIARIREIIKDVVQTGVLQIREAEQKLLEVDSNGTCGKNGTRPDSNYGAMPLSELPA